MPAATQETEGKRVTPSGGIRRPSGFRNKEREREARGRVSSLWELPHDRAQPQPRLEPGECQGCGYLGWALVADLSEPVRRTLRERAPELRFRLCAPSNFQREGDCAEGALGRGDDEGGRELSRLRGADPHVRRALARAHQGRGCASERRARLAGARRRRSGSPQRATGSPQGSSTTSSRSTSSRPGRGLLRT